MIVLPLYIYVSLGWTIRSCELVHTSDHELAIRTVASVLCGVSLVGWYINCALAKSLMVCPVLVLLPLLSVPVFACILISCSVLPIGLLNLSYADANSGVCDHAITLLR